MVMAHASPTSAHVASGGTVGGVNAHQGPRGPVGGLVGERIAEPCYDAVGAFPGLL